MTEAETIQILAMLSAFYAGGKNNPKHQAKAWHKILQKYDYVDAESAVLRFAENDTRDYATFPAVGKIVNEIRCESKRKAIAIREIIRAVGYGRDYYELGDDAKALIPESSFLKWRDEVDPEEFATNQKKYADFLKNRQQQMFLEASDE